MLIGFIARISAINALFATLFGLSFQQISATSFIRWRGVSASRWRCAERGSIMATKLGR